MPHNFDFSKVQNIKTLEVEPQGWINPLSVEYGVAEEGDQISGLQSYYWRVKGTTHTFVIPILRIDYLSQGDYKKHFENTLESFREDYLSWKEEGFLTEWSREYCDQYSRFIVI